MLLYNIQMCGTASMFLQRKQLMRNYYKLHIKVTK
jgi:hypothetical protein